MAADPSQKDRSGLFLFLVIPIVLFGIALRFYRITANDFFLYDEGYYLNYSRLLLEIVEAHFRDSLYDFREACKAVFEASFASNKPLWFLTVNVRVFFVGTEGWFFPRVISAVFGSLTLVPLFMFARRFFQSNAVAWISVALLAVLPSHVFYSRLGMQEALSTFLFAWGFYFYCFPRQFSARTILSAVFLAGAFLTNYRLIVLPLLVGFAELFLSIAEARRFAIRKYVWHALTFFSFVVFISVLDEGHNALITFGWMFRQMQLAQQPFDWLNLLSYPYYLFRLDHPLLVILFFGNFYLAVRRRWLQTFPFFLVLIYMLMFSFTGEKGMRFLCVMIPFFVMSAAVLLEDLWQRRARILRGALIVLIVIMTGGMLARSVHTAALRTDYGQATAYLTETDSQGKIAATQKWIINLYVEDPQTVGMFPADHQSLIEMYLNGTRYLLIDPQVYISWTESGHRFDPLKGFLNFIVDRMKPVKAFSHFDRVMLERFVFEHNENLRRSVQFLRTASPATGELRIYDLTEYLQAVSRLRR
jgi:hypothetical protein